PEPKLVRITPFAGALVTNNGVAFQRSLTQCVPVPLHGQRENYGDMTGQKLLASTAPSGFWTFTHDGVTTNKPWLSLAWTASTSNTNQVRVEFRTGNSSAQLSTNGFQLASNGAT